MDDFDLNRAIDLHRAGQMAKAAEIYLSLINRGIQNPKPYYLLGVIYHDQGQSARGIELCKLALERDPSSFAALNNLGSIYAETKQLDLARECFERALNVDPLHQGALKNIVSILLAQGEDEQLEKRLRSTLALDPMQEWANAQLVALLNKLGRVKDSIAHLRTLDLGTPETQWVKRLLPALLVDQAAIQSPEASSSADSDDVASLIEGIRTLFKSGLIAEAHGAVTELAPRYPKNVELKQLHSLALQAAGKFREAISVAETAISLDPSNGGSFLELASAKALNGEVEEANRAYTRSLELKPDDAVQIIFDLNLPQVMGTKEEVHASRQKFVDAVSRLAKAPPRLDLPFRSIGQSNFYLSFQGLNDREPLSHFAQFCLKADPKLSYVAPHTLRDPTPGSKIKIGFISDFIYRHSVAICFARVVAWLSHNELFEVFLISSTPESQESREMYSNYSGQFIKVLQNYESARETIANLHLDVLVHMDIGMSLQNYYLALARLARVQCAVGGHPVTTGIPNMDYWLSCDKSEHENADDHYSEQLIRLPYPAMYLERPNYLPSSKFGYPKGRTEYGLPPTGRLYACPVALQKLHPDFDEIIHKILDSDSTGYVVIVKSHAFDSWNQAIKRRHERTLPQRIASRILYVPWMSSPLDFANFLVVADVILDPIHFGIGSTAVTLFSAGATMVTLPTEFLRGRTGLFFSRVLDLPEIVAKSEDDYVQRAIELASNRDLREDLNRRVRENDGALFEYTKPLEDLAGCIQSIALKSRMNA